MTELLFNPWLIVAVGLFNLAWIASVYLVVSYMERNPFFIGHFAVWLIDQLVRAGDYANFIPSTLKK